MKQYLDILRNIVQNGIEKPPTRINPNTGAIEPVDGGVNTIGLPNLIFSHNMEDGFPLLTCRKMPFKSVCVELEGFINGITSKKWYVDRGCKYWSEWCNPSIIPKYVDKNNNLVSRFISNNTNDIKDTGWRDITWEEKKKYMIEQDDLGPLGYSWGWRNFGKNYDCGSNVLNGINEGFDQLKEICIKLVTSPNDRRMICSAWNPSQNHLTALPSCHYSWGVTVYGNKLNLMYTMRSCDILRGQNGSLYGLLLYLLSKHANLTPGNLTGIYMDCHIYDRDVEYAKILINREPKQLPSIELKYNDKFDIFKWTHNDISLLDYNPHPSITLPPVVV